MSKFFTNIFGSISVISITSLVVGIATMITWAFAVPTLVDIVIGGKVDAALLDIITGIVVILTAFPVLGAATSAASLLLTCVIALAVILVATVCATYEVIADKAKAMFKSKE